MSLELIKLIKKEDLCCTFNLISGLSISLLFIMKILPFEIGCDWLKIEFEATLNDSGLLTQICFIGSLLSIVLVIAENRVIYHYCEKYSNEELYEKSANIFSLFSIAEVIYSVFLMCFSITVFLQYWIAGDFYFSFIAKVLYIIVFYRLLVYMFRKKKTKFMQRFKEVNNGKKPKAE